MRCKRFLFPNTLYQQAIDLTKGYEKPAVWDVTQTVYKPRIVCDESHINTSLCFAYTCFIEVWAHVAESELFCKLQLLELQPGGGTYFKTEGLLGALLNYEGDLDILWGECLEGRGGIFEKEEYLEKARSILAWGGRIPEHTPGTRLAFARKTALREYSNDIGSVAKLLAVYKDYHPTLQGEYLGEVGETYANLGVVVLGCTPCTGWGHLQYRIVGHTGGRRVTWMSRQPRGIGRMVTIAGRVHLHSNAECEKETVLRGVKDVA